MADGEAVVESEDDSVRDCDAVLLNESVTEGESVLESEAESVTDCDFERERESENDDVGDAETE